MGKKMLNEAKRNDFHKEEERVIYMIEKGYYLEKKDINHIFKNIIIEQFEQFGQNDPSKDDFSLANAVRFLMKNLTGKAKDALVEMINSTFKFKISYSRQMTMVEDYDSSERWCGYEFVCDDESVRSVILDIYKMFKQDKNLSISQEEVLKAFGL